MVSSKVFFKKAREIGSAVWLLTLYFAVSRPLENSPWFVVAEGSPITDREAAEFMCVSIPTATSWRKRLMRVGLVQADRCRSGGFHIRVQRTHFAMAGGVTLQAHTEARANEGTMPHLATEVLQ